MKKLILEAGREALELDPHSRGGVYRVTSQYYDTLDLRSYWEKLDGVNPRRKFRLRFYGNQAGEDDTYFIETKYRLDQTVFKERLRLEPAAALEFLDNQIPLEDMEEVCRLEHPGQREALANLSFACRELRLPSNVISYLREPWIGGLDRRLRLTFDHLACALYWGQYRQAIEGRGLPLFSQRQVLMEVKFTSRLPVWLRDILCRNGLTPIRFSKYATGIEKLNRRDNPWQAMSTPGN